MAMQDISAYVRNLKEQLAAQKNGDLAEQLKIDEAKLSRWCNGEEIPDDESCIKLASVAGDDPAKVLILKNLSTASMMTRSFWEKAFIKYRYGRTFPISLIQRSRNDRRRSVIQFKGADRRLLLNDRRRGLDRRLGLAV
ncbi:MAG TPA: hypothetical protein VMN77_12675 [Nitrospiria bacterium]|jgi:plasmid maintenance system antidote protein VapI|nr:hypothetical protein [Nitrospiria bacterium]